MDYAEHEKTYKTVPRHGEMDGDRQRSAILIFMAVTLL